MAARLMSDEELLERAGMVVSRLSGPTSDNHGAPPT